MNANPLPPWKRNRRILGMSAILLPFDEQGDVDWQGFDQHLLRTWKAGLIPAVNMDTGYANLIDASTRVEVLDRTRELSEGRKYVAGVFVKDSPSDRLSSSRYRQGIEEISNRSGLPIIFQSFGLTGLSEQALLDAYQDFGNYCQEFLAFELGEMFAPFGKIYSIDTFRGLLGIQACVGAKHSSLDRLQEWERLKIRDAERPEFMVLTGNDLAIDMVFYGSDYLLGLSTFAPDLFALRDRYWLEGDSRALSVNDILQYLGMFAFRNPVPAYKHSAAQFLKIRGWIRCSSPFPGSARRPDSDEEILKEIWHTMSRWLDDSPSP